MTPAFLARERQATVYAHQNANVYEVGGESHPRLQSARKSMMGYASGRAKWRSTDAVGYATPRSRVNASMRLCSSGVDRASRVAASTDASSLLSHRLLLRWVFQRVTVRNSSRVYQPRAPAARPIASTSPSSAYE